MNSILQSIKKMLGIAADYTHFDAELINHINSAFSTLTQLGVGPTEGFFITGSTEIWDDFLQDNIKLESVKSYVHLKVKLLFDPPLNSAIITSYENQIREYEWRLNVAVDPPIA